MRNESAPSRHERRQTRRYLMEAAPALVVALTPVVALAAQGTRGFPPPVPLLLVAVAILGALWFLLAVVRHLRRADEYEQQRLRATFSWAFGAAMLAAFVLAVLGLAGVLIDHADLIIFAVGMTGWLLAGALMGRR